MRNILTIVVCAVALWVLGCGGGAGSDEPVMLRFDLEPGVTYLQNVTMELGVVLEMEGRRGGGDVEADFELRMPVSRAETPGHKLVAATVERVVAHARMQGRRMEYDSEDPQNSDPMLAMIMDPVSNIDMKMELDETGRFVDVIGVDSLMAGGWLQGQDVLGQFLRDDANHDLMNTWIVDGLPKEPISKGDTWSFRTASAAPTGEMIMHGTCEHRGIKKVNGVECVVLGLEVQMEMGKPEKADPQVEAPEADVEDMGTTGRIFWDPVRNFPVRTEMKSGLTIRMDGPMGKGRMEVPISMNIIADMWIEETGVAETEN
jgi:hypothetical protein